MRQVGEKIKQERYKNGARDLIDEWADRYAIEDFRLVIWAVIERYGRRAGKKDDVIKEIDKMIDYLNRWKEVENEQKRQY